MKLNFSKAAITGVVFAGLFAGSSAYAADIVGLITKTEGNPFLPLAISILRLFGNEARHSQRSPHLHMVRMFAV